MYFALGKERSASRSSSFYLGLSIFCCYSVVGVSFGCIPSIVIQGMGGGDGAVGLAMGCYAFSAILSRAIGGFAMRSTGYRQGLNLAALFLVIATFVSALSQTYPLLIAARLLLGVGVGLMMAVATAWMVELPTGSGVAGKLGSVGTINYIVLALMAPLGAYLSEVFGARAVLLVFGALPLFALMSTRLVTDVPIPKAEHTQKFFLKKVATVCVLPGIALMMSGIGYASIVSFGLQLGVHKGLQWPALLVFTYGLTMVAFRLTITRFAEYLTSRLAIALLFVSEATGLFLLSQGTTYATLILGATLVGFAMSLIFPLLGLGVARNSDVAMRGTNLAIFGTFINLGIGVGSLVVGLLAATHTVTTAFAVGGLFAIFGGCVAVCRPTLRAPTTVAETSG